MHHLGVYFVPNMFDSKSKLINWGVLPKICLNLTRHDATNVLDWFKSGLHAGQLRTENNWDLNQNLFCMHYEWMLPEIYTLEQLKDSQIPVNCSPMNLCSLALFDEHSETWAKWDANP